MSDEPKEEHVTGLRQIPNGKWHGQVSDVAHAAKHPGAKQKIRNTSCVASRQVAVEALAALKKAVRAEYEAIVLGRLQADPLTKDLPRAPKDLSTAVPRQCYWVCNHLTKHAPVRVVVGKHRKTGFQWLKACVHCPVNDAATVITNSRVVATTPSCLAHGGVCIHGKNPTACRVCNDGKQRMIFCSNCTQTTLKRKRQVSAGGNGLCPDCEAHAVAEAAEVGAAPPPKGKRWEDVVLDELETLVTDPEGNVIAYEMRDDKSNMFGSNKRARKGECSTDHQRRPDILWLVRNAESRIVAAVMVEVDENSHTDRDPVCEGGKIHDTFQAIVKLAQEEGKGRLAEVRHGKVLTPQVLFIRFNPNACDAPDGPIWQPERVQVLAARVRELLNTPVEVYQQRSRNGECMKPFLEILYYHTKKGAKNLAFYEEHKESFHLTPNKCPRV